MYLTSILTMSQKSLAIYLHSYKFIHLHSIVSSLYLKFVTAYTCVCRCNLYPPCWMHTYLIYKSYVKYIYSVLVKIKRCRLCSLIRWWFHSPSDYTEFLYSRIVESKKSIPVASGIINQRNVWRQHSCLIPSLC